jgi:drug/metabolite transporter (DMT)-like permease
LKNQSISFNAWLAFAVVSIFWGTTFYAIRVGVESFPPLLMAGFRHTIGGVLICSYFLLRGYSLPGIKQLKTFAINGILMLSLGNGLVTWAEMYVSSGLAALICALTPVWIILFNTFSAGKEPIGWRVLVGICLCLFGQILIFYDNFQDLMNPAYAMGIVAVLMANFTWAMGTVYARNHQTNVHPLFGAGLQMIAGGLLLDITGTLRGEWVGFNPEPKSVWALIYLISVGSIISYGAYMYVIKKMPASIVSTYAYINTMVAIVLGWALLDEKLTVEMISAAILTIGGVWLVSKTTKKQA